MAEAAADAGPQSPLALKGLLQPCPTLTWWGLGHSMFYRCAGASWDWRSQPGWKSKKLGFQILLLPPPSDQEYRETHRQRFVISGIFREIWYPGKNRRLYRGEVLIQERFELEACRRLDSQSREENRAGVQCRFSPGVTGTIQSLRVLGGAQPGNQCKPGEGLGGGK